MQPHVVKPVDQLEVFAMGEAERAGAKAPEVGMVLDELHTRMRRQGVSQAEVERHCGWSDRYLSRVFHGKAHLRLGQLFEILDFIGTNPAVFFGAVFAVPVSPQQRAEIVEDILRQLNVKLGVVPANDTEGR